MSSFLQANKAMNSLFFNDIVWLKINDKNTKLPSVSKKIKISLSILFLFYMCL
jgi:hypothetical protein